MKKILIYSIAYHPFVGGAEVAVKEITDRISDIEFHMLTLNLDGKQRKYEKIGNVHVHRIGSGNVGKYLFPFISLPKALSLHRKTRFDAIWSIMANYAGFGALFFKIFKPKLTFILTLQEGDPIDHIKRRVGLFYPLFRQIFKRANVVQAISNYLANFAKNMGYAGDVEVIPNGVDTYIFSRDYGEQELGALRWQFHKETKDVFLVTTSRLVTKNAVSDVISALHFLPNNVKFLIVGVGPLEKSLKKLALDLGVDKRVIFAGFVEYKEIPKYLKISDIFIRPSLSEGMGNSFIEAMAAGIPVIATPVGGIPDFLKENKTGLFCKVQNGESIALCVNKILDNEKLRKDIVSNALKMVAKEYDWAHIVRQMEDSVFAKI
ncbi:MAG: glycosyltransferase family 4 protein [Candidatus Paceibacterota bacterium]